MPKFLEDILKRAYPGNPHAVYGTLNAIGAMHGNKETAKGAAMEAKHDAKAIHPKMAAHGAKVKAAHAHLSANMPKFKTFSPAKRMAAVQAHIRRAK